LDRKGSLLQGKDQILIGLLPPDKSFLADLSQQGIEFSTSEALMPPALPATPESTLAPTQAADETKTPEPSVGLSGETISLPGFGDLPTANLGVLIYRHQDQSNTLMMLADSQEHLIGLIKLYASGDLTGCVIQGSIGVCQVGSANN
jgi:hypothetical protein